MTNSTVQSSGVGRLTGFMLALVIVLCLALIGFSGYFKYQLDRSEAALAAPDSAVTADQSAVERLRRALGYSGFVGSAQAFLSTHDKTNVNDMKADVRDAQEVLTRLPEKTPPDARHDLQSIVEMFSTTAQKAEQSANDPSVGFTSNDMGALYAALPLIDQRAAAAMAAGRYNAQGDLKLWATLLTLIAWISLIATAAATAGIYLNLRGKQAAPYRALAQSVQNMARGDMRTPIWGMERQDMVGELARAIDLARYHFSQLPDMSLLTEQGPMRIRFEGQARSLFEAMMQNIARDSESIRTQAGTLEESVNSQKDAVDQVSARITEAINMLYQDRQNNEAQVQQLLQSVAGSAQSMRGAQTNTEAQLGHLIAYLEERAKGMAEVTQIAGRQVAQTLQSLSYTEHNLRLSAEQNQMTVGKLAASTDELGERLFGAVSLLRAGGKVLTETAETTQGRLNEAISLLSQSEGSLRNMLVQGFEPVGNPIMKLTNASAVARGEEADKLQTIIAGLENAQRKFEECLSQQNSAADQQIQALTTHSNSLITQASTTAQTLAAVTNQLRSEQDKLGETGLRFATVLENIGTRLEARVMESLSRADAAVQNIDRLSELGSQLGTAVEKLHAFSVPAPVADNSEPLPDDLVLEIKTGFEITNRSIARLREEFVTSALTQEAPSYVPALAGPDNSSEILGQISTANETISRAIAQQTEIIESRLADMEKKIAAGTGSSAPAASVGGMSAEEAQSQLQQQAAVLSELASALGAIDQHMQEMGAKFSQSNGRMAS